MIDKKMSDEQIIKAFEKCITIGERCEDCPFCGYTDCNTRLKECFLDLINRKDAEIERLNAKFERLMKEQLEKELFEGNHYSFHNGKLCAIPKTEEKQIKSEAYKEFAEKFKGLLKEYAPYDTLHIYEIQDRIDIVEDILTEGGNEDGTNHS